MRTIYLDYNATTPIAPPVQEAMLPFLTEHFGNPSSHHALGRACAEALEEARNRVAQLLGADPAEIVFTSGGSESANLAVLGVAVAHGAQRGGHIVVSAFEHPSVSEPARFLQRMGFTLSVVDVDRKGVVDPEDVADALRPDTFLVSIMHANNEIGTIQPIRAIAELCRTSGVLLHTDAAQSVGKIPARVDDLSVDLLTLSGHKFYGPKGVGALYVRQGTPLEPILRGAGHESGLRAGTENVASIVGLGRAATLAENNLQDAGDRMETLRDRLLGRLTEGVGRGLSVNGRGADRLPNTLSVNFPGVRGSALLARLPELCASTGSAWHSGSTSMSDTLAALGLSPEVATGTVRLSLGWYTTEEEVDKAADALVDAWESLR